MSRIPCTLLAVAAAITALAACGGNVNSGGTGGATSGTPSTSSTTGGMPGAGGSATGGSATGGAATGGAPDGGGPPPGCAACKAGERCDVLNACYFPPQPSYCVPCDQHPICGSDGKIYDSDCAAIAAGHAGVGVTCAPPAGRYTCGWFFCDAATEDCQHWSPVPSFPEPESRCVPCSSVSGRACGDDGQVYPSACALLQSGHRRGTACPGFVGCGADACDTTVATCVMGFVADCEGGAPTFTCKPIGDAGP